MLSKFRIFLVCLTAAIALWYTGRFFLLLSDYWKLSGSVPAEITEWNVQEISGSEYGIEAMYAYEVKGVPYRGKTLFDSPTYLNDYAANAELYRWKSHQWEAWFQPSHPEISSLQRKFPAKPLVHATITLFIFFYFLFALNFLSKDSRKST